MGLVGNMDLSDNMMLRSFRNGKSVFTDRATPHKLAGDVVDELEVVTPSIETPVRRLSGGNVQKILVLSDHLHHPLHLAYLFPVCFFQVFFLPFSFLIPEYLLQPERFHLDLQIQGMSTNPAASWPAATSAAGLTARRLFTIGTPYFVTI